MDMDVDVDMDHVQTGMFSGGSSASDCESWQAGTLAALAKLRSQG